MSFLKRLSDTPFRSGCGTVFIKLSKKRGLKLFNNERTRDEAFTRQSIAARHGLGPNVYKTIDNVVFQDETMWGYYTEAVTVLSKKRLNDISDANFDAYLKIRRVVRDQADDVRASLKAVGVSFTDNHMYNVGWKRGKCVAIDFDEGCGQICNKLYNHS